MGFLHGKHALVIGIVSRRSNAWGIANAMHREGAQLAFTYPNEHLRNCVEEAANAFGSNIVLPCAPAEDAQVSQLFEALARHWTGIDALVHVFDTVPYAMSPGGPRRQGSTIPRNDLAALAMAAAPLMAGRSGAILALPQRGAMYAPNSRHTEDPATASFEASVRHLASSLEAEGIRVNAISTGPIGIPAVADDTGIREVSDRIDAVTTLRRSVTIDEIGNVAAFLCSSLASGITGETIRVGAGLP